MAVRFNLDKFQTIKQAYIAYLTTGKFSNEMSQLFAAYKPYLEADEEIRNLQNAIKSQKAAKQKRIEEQKKAEQKRLEEQRQAKNAAVKAAREAAQAKKNAKKKNVSAPVGNHHWTDSSAPVKKVRGHVSPVARRLQNVTTVDELKGFMSASFIGTLKSADDLAVMRSTIVRCTVNNEEEKKAWLRIVEERRMSLQTKVAPKHNVNYENPKAVIIPTPMGGLPKRY